MMYNGSIGVFMAGKATTSVRRKYINTKSNIANHQI